MKNSNKTFIIILIVAILLVGGIMYAVGKGSGSSVSQSGAPAKELADMNSLLGEPAPDFTLQDKAGKEVKLSDLRGKTVVLFFNEGLMCYPACWNQMAQLSSDPRLNTDSVKSYSIVVDQASNWAPAVAKMPELAQANVLYDTDSTVSKEYGMLKAGSSMHYAIYPGHSYVVIDPQGTVKFIFDDPRMAINNDKIAQEITN
jgi:peroxiredoxin Q/BCP